MQKGLVSEDTSPSAFVARNSSATLLINPVPSNPTAQIGSAGGGI
jgi:hypothetical protein